MKRAAWMHTGGKGERYPAALVAVADGASGVYLLRDHVTRELLYVGESHSGNLLRTLVRHLQWWSRGKRFWAQRGFSAQDPGVSYDRASIDVQAIRTRADQAQELQRRLIGKLRPRDNVYLLDPLPF